MRLSHILFLASTALLLIVIGSFLVSPSLRPASGPDVAYESLDHAEVGSMGTLWWGYAMGLAIFATLAATVLIGVRRRGRIGSLGLWLTVGFVCHGLIFTALVVSYARYVDGSGSGFFGGLPAPTAWMLYVLWPFPLLMIGAGMVYFEREYFSDEDQRKFDALIQSGRKRRGARN
jgi:hypothetical protein